MATLFVIERWQWRRRLGQRQRAVVCWWDIDPDCTPSGIHVQSFTEHVDVRPPQCFQQLTDIRVCQSINQSINQSVKSIKRFLGGLSRVPTVGSTESKAVSWCPACGQGKTSWRDVSWGGDEMWPMILLMPSLPGDHSKSAGRWPRKKSATNSRQSADRHSTFRLLGRSAKRVKWPRYPGASPWTTLYVNTAILNSILSGTRRPARRRCGRIAAGDRSTAQPRSALTGVVGPSNTVGQPGRPSVSHILF